MPHYIIAFTGRTIGAIGITHRINTSVDADSHEAAKLKLYDKWDTITDISIKERGAKVKREWKLKP